MKAPPPFTRWTSPVGSDPYRGRRVGDQVPSMETVLLDRKKAAGSPRPTRVALLALLCGGALAATSDRPLMVGIGVCVALIAFAVFATITGEAADRANIKMWSWDVSDSRVRARFLAWLWFVPDSTESAADKALQFVGVVLLLLILAFIP